MLSDQSAAIRPTRRRLRAATGLSALLVAGMLAVLGPLVDFAPSGTAPGLEHEDRLTVFLRSDEGEPVAEPVSMKEAAPPPPQRQVASSDRVDQRQAAAAPSSPEVPADPQPATDWRAMAKAAAKASVDEYFSREKSRAATWRETHSVMFRPAGDFVVKAEAPVLAGVRFKPEVHVLGLGVTIGSCFIGLPLLGVPVEQRTVAINLFVCAGDAG